ncbi:MAG: CHASE2 domain-containing protein [Chloroflexi bacterium]|nr:CHASE2 domain-containing protein [Chloroflexota bacterium]
MKRTRLTWKRPKTRRSTTKLKTNLKTSQVPSVRNTAQTGLAWQWRIAISLGVGLGVAALVLLVWWGDLFVSTRLRFTDVFYVEKEPSSQLDVVIVAVDDATLDSYGSALVSWPRRHHVTLVNILSDAGARVVAFDILFGAQPATETADPVTGQTVLAGGDPALAAAFTQAADFKTVETGDGDTNVVNTRVVLPVVGALRQASTGSIEYAEFLLPSQELREAARMLGHTNMLTDPDGSIRWLSTRVQAGDQTYLSFSLVTFMAATGATPLMLPHLVTFEDGRVITPELNIPIDDQDRMLINYFGAPDDGTFPAYSYRAVLAGEVDPAVFHDKIVLVGLMNHTGLGDMYDVPIGLDNRMMAGVEVHANALQTLLDHEPLTMQNRTSQALMIVALTLIASVLYGQAVRRWFWLALAIPGVIVGTIGGLFVYANLNAQVMDLFDALLAVVLPAPAIIVLHTGVETRLRRRAELLLDSMVAASSQRLDLEPILASIAADLRFILPRASRVEVWVWNAGTGTLDRALVDPTTTDSAAAPAHDAGTLPAIPSRRQVCRALESGQLLREDQRIAVPMRWQGQPVGVLVARTPGLLTPERRAVLRMFAWQTASIITNARLYAHARDLSDLKTRMIRMASHDLKNPLGVIVGYVELLEMEHGREPFLSELQQDYLRKMNDSAERMLTIVNEILSVERAERGLEMVSEYDLGALLLEVATFYLPQMEEKHHTFDLDMPDDFPGMSGDPGQVREALSNLLGNAIKYTPDGGEVTLRLAQHDGKARVEVRDSGVGIAEDAQARLFTPFYRVRTGATATIPGTGLGLSLVKAVIEAHDGRV